MSDYNCKCEDMEKLKTQILEITENAIIRGHRIRGIMDDIQRLQESLEEESIKAAGSLYAIKVLCKSMESK